MARLIAAGDLTDLVTLLSPVEVDAQGDLPFGETNDQQYQPWQEVWAKIEWLNENRIEAATTIDPRPAAKVTIYRVPEIRPGWRVQTDDFVLNVSTVLNPPAKDVTVLMCLFHANRETQ